MEDAAWSGAATPTRELQHRIAAGTQVLSDLALRRVLSGGAPEDWSEEARADRPAPTPPKLTRSRSVQHPAAGSAPDSGVFRPPDRIPQKVPTLQRAATAVRSESCGSFGSKVTPFVEEVPCAECGICFTAASELPQPARRLCCNIGCKSAFCNACFGQYAAGKVSSALHWAPPIPCPGCRGRVPTDVWMALVPAEMRERYNGNAASLLSVRCHECDGVFSLLVGSDQEVLTDEQKQARKSHLDLFQQDQELDRLWFAYTAGRLSPDKMFSAMRDRIDKNASSGDKLKLHAVEPLKAALSLVEDVERRVTLQLAWLRQHPKIRTPCCQAKTCFKCKVDGWHEGVSCEQRQQRYAKRQDGVQCCPECHVPTQRTEGCMQVACVCGHRWEWQHDSDEDDDSDDDNIEPLPRVIVGTVLDRGSDGLVGLLRALANARADMNSLRSEKDTAFHWAAMAPGDVEGVHHFTKRSDSSRLQALQILLASGELPMLENAVDAEDAIEDSDVDTPLSVALGFANADAVSWLVAHGATLKECAIDKFLHLQDQCSMRPADCKFFLEAMRPLLEGFWRAGAEVGTMLLAALLFGEVAKATELLQSEDTRRQILLWWPAQGGTRAATAFIVGTWAAGESLAGGGRDDLVEELKRYFATWDKDLESAASGFLVWAVLKNRWQLGEQADVSCLQLALDAKANVNHEWETPKQSTLFESALSRRQVVATQLLLKAGVMPEQEGWEKAVLSSLCPVGAAGLLPVLQDHLPSWDAQPLWVALQVGNTEQVKQALVREMAKARAGSQPAKSVEEVAVAFVRRSMCREKNPLPDEAVFSSRLSEGAWDGYKKDAATALFQLEIRQATNLESSPDAEVVRALLAQGAEPNKSPKDLSSYLKKVALSNSVEGEDETNTPLINLARNRYCSREDADRILGILAEFKADLELADEDDDSPLMNAFATRSIGVAEALFARGVRVGRQELHSLAGSDDGLNMKLILLVGYRAWFKLAYSFAQRPNILESAERPVEAHLARLALHLDLEDGHDPSFEGLLQDEDGELDIDVREACATAILLAESRVAASYGEAAKVLEGRIAAWRAELRRTQVGTDELRDVAEELLRGEVHGANNGRWELASDWVTFLIAQGVDVNMMINVADSEGEDNSSTMNIESEDEEEEEGTDPDRDIGSGIGSGSED